MTTVYISGPMQGKPGLNFDNFMIAATAFRDLGFEVLNPAEWGCYPEGEKTHEWYLKRDLDCLRTHVQAGKRVIMYLLDGWADSEGAKQEYHYARDHGLTVYTHHCLTPREVAASETKKGFPLYGASSGCTPDEVPGSATREPREDVPPNAVAGTDANGTLKWLMNVGNTTDDGTLRTFATGATRDTAQDKLDYDGFLSPPVLKRYAEYMHSHRKQSDGTLRDSDNWQKGIPRTVYRKSAWRHFFDWWQAHRKGEPVAEQACALLFNIMGDLHEELKANDMLTVSGGREKTDGQ